MITHNFLRSRLDHDDYFALKMLQVKDWALGGDYRSKAIDYCQSRTVFYVFSSAFPQRTLTYQLSRLDSSLLPFLWLCAYIHNKRCNGRLPDFQGAIATRQLWKQSFPLDDVKTANVTCMLAETFAEFMTHSGPCTLTKSLYLHTLLDKTKPDHLRNILHALLPGKNKEKITKAELNKLLEAWHTSWRHQHRIAAAALAFCSWTKSPNHVRCGLRARVLCCACPWLPVADCACLCSGCSPTSCAPSPTSSQPRRTKPEPPTTPSCATNHPSRARCWTGRH